MLSIDEKLSFLQKVSAFKMLTKDECTLLAEMCEEKTYATGDRIFSQGDLGGALYIVVDGRVALEREIRSNTDTVSLSMVEGGAYFGVISLFHEAPRSATATAITDTRILKLDDKDFRTFACNHAELLVEVNHVLCQRLIEAYDKISEITQHDKPRELRNLYDKLDF